MTLLLHQTNPTFPYQSHRRSFSRRFPSRSPPLRPSRLLASPLPSFGRRELPSPFRGNEDAYSFRLDELLDVKSMLFRFPEDWDARSAVSWAFCCAAARGISAG
jgi:hypothetical protein